MAIVLDGNNLTTSGLLNSMTAQNTTSGTYVDFTGIPSTTKRITVMLKSVSLSGSSYVAVQIGSGSVDTTGYVATGSNIQPSGAGSYNFSAGFCPYLNGAAYSFTGIVTLAHMGSNIWVASGLLVIDQTSTQYTGPFGGYKTLSGTLDRVRIGSLNGSDTLDNGSVNILYE